jgi:hypothetical protein
MRRERIITMSPEGLRWLSLLEGGHYLNAYQDTAGVWTISAGVTYYSHGVRVKKGDKLKGIEESEMLFRERLLEYEATVDAYTRDDINVDPRLLIDERVEVRRQSDDRCWIVYSFTHDQLYELHQRNLDAVERRK